MSVTVKQADITPGSTEVAKRLRDIQCLQVESNQMVRLGDFWEKDPTGPVVILMLRRWH